jgi:aspartyl-tRNA(Asn)/glutamyl-tRNA(Gln) amidotransferase subunit A
VLYVEGPLTITEAMPLLRSGELTPRSLLEQCLARIDIYEPAVKAWAYLDRERARREADQLTKELKSGHDRGPLHGIPIGIKDIIDVFDMPTGCGSKLWANSYARKDAEVVLRLRQAGALILGKTVTTPYAYLDPPSTRNPWNLERTPGGSSSGSAAAVACGMCLAALGTQTGGSTTRPASYCGVYSLKPSWGNISVFGVLPLAPSLDHIGLLANSVRDLAFIFQHAFGDDLNPFHPNQDYSREINKGMEENWHIYELGGVFKNELKESSDYDNVTAILARALRGYDTAIPPPSFGVIPHAYKVLISTEAAEFHAVRLSRHPDDYGRHFHRLILDGLRFTGVEYRQAILSQRAIHTELNDLLSILNFYLTPGATDFAPNHESTGNPVFNIPWSFTGLPTVSIPAGRSPDGLPFSLQLVASRNRENNLLRAAAHVDSILCWKCKLPPVPR